MESNIPDNSEPTQDYVLLTVLSVFFGALGVTLLYLVLKIWPSGISSVPENVRIFGSSYLLTPEHRYLLLMTLGGALGASVHLLISFTAFVGNRAFVTSWVPWYMLRPIIGAGMALFFYMLLRGGILTYSPSTTSPPNVAQTNAPAAQPDTSNKVQGPPPAPAGDTTGADTTGNDTSGNNTSGSNASGNPAAPPAAAAGNIPPVTQPAPVPPLNPFGMMAIACMVGLFSKEASKKLEELFKTLFNVREEQQVPYKDKLPTDKRAQDPASTVAVTPEAGAKGGAAPADDINDVLPDADDDATGEPDHKDAEPQG
ncbi:MAG TPA: hypothetical protein VFS25_08355 [Chitinophaga sp.]|uniref:hypothetical protein n=1 Tax=Chitinophaga sp. TaxID=1869181 RepID=UPI002DBC128C|nr:hypothetical protein [Chitinophaga sp.]HEU4552831.1 hypothetical protein [Chitinophaga sp.]